MFKNDFPRKSQLRLLRASDVFRTSSGRLSIIREKMQKLIFCFPMLCYVNSGKLCFENAVEIYL